MKKTIFSALLLLPQLLYFSHAGDLSSPMLDQQQDDSSVSNARKAVEALNSCLKQIKNNDSPDTVGELSSVLSEIESCSDDEVQSLIENPETSGGRLPQQASSESGHSVVDMSSIADTEWLQDNYFCLSSLLYMLSISCVCAGGGLIYLGKILNEGGSSCKRIDSNGRITNDFWSESCAKHIGADLAYDAGVFLGVAGLLGGAVMAWRHCHRW